MSDSALENWWWVELIFDFRIPSLVFSGARGREGGVTSRPRLNRAGARDFSGFKYRSILIYISTQPIARWKPYAIVNLFLHLWFSSGCNGRQAREGIDVTARYEQGRNARFWLVQVPCIICIQRKPMVRWKNRLAASFIAINLNVLTKVQKAGTDFTTRPHLDLPWGWWGGSMKRH